MIPDYYRIAFERNQRARSCPECYGRGYFPGAHGSDDIECASCAGNGLLTAECGCGTRTVLVQSSPHSEDDPEYRCAKCAVTCDMCCQALSTHCDENGAQYCDDCHVFNESAGDTRV